MPLVEVKEKKLT